MAFTVQNPNAAKAAKIAAARAASAPAASDGVLAKFVAPAECSERIRIVFDDSGSMTSQIEDAKSGVIEFLRNCIPNQTAVAVHFLQTGVEPTAEEQERRWSYTPVANPTAKRLAELSSNLPEVSVLLREVKLQLGGTPLFKTLGRVIATAPFATRLIMFTDGQPTDSILPYEPVESDNPRLFRWRRDADVIITNAKEHSMPIDTVFFGAAQYNEDEIALLKYFAEQTGGYFLHFDPAKVNFRTAFKYLAPVNRLQLASESFRASIERGERQ